MNIESRPVTSADVVALAKRLADKGVEYVVFGSVVLELNGIGRATTDIDIFLRNTESNLRRFVEVITELSAFANLEIDELLALIESGELAYGVTRLVGEYTIDVTISMGINNIDNVKKQKYKYMGNEVIGITKEELYRMKTHSMRPQDKADIIALRKFLGLR